MSDKPPGKNGWRWIVLAVAGLLAALTGTIVLALQKQPHPTLTLTNGTQVTLLPAASSTPEAHLGNPLQLLLFRTIPPPLNERVGTTAFTETGLGCISFRLRSSRIHPDLFATVFDENGDESQGARGCWENGYVSFTFHAYPQRGRTAGLRLYAPGAPITGPNSNLSAVWKKLGEISLPGPHAPNLTYWQAPPLPISTTEGDLNLKLEALDVGDSLAPANEPRGVGETFASAAIRLRKGDHPARGWKVRLETILDASGNQWYPAPISQTQRPERVLLRFRTPPRLAEPIWRLQFRLYRDDTSSFAPAELARWRHLPRPGPYEVVRSGARRTIGGIPLVLVGVYGKGTRPLAPFHSYRLERSIGVVVCHPKGDAGAPQHTVLRLPSRNGRSVGFRWAAVASTSDGALRLYEADTPMSEGTFDLDYAIHSSHTLELTAPRKLVQP